MAVRWRENGDIACAATSEAEPGDEYIGDKTHYQLTVVERVLIPDEDEKQNGLWYFKTTEGLK